MFAWYIFVYPFSFNITVSLNKFEVSFFCVCEQPIVVLYVCVLFLFYLDHLGLR